MEQPEDGPYRHVDLAMATRMGGGMFLAGGAIAAVALPLAPPTGPLGLRGVLAFLAFELLLGIRQLRRSRPAGPNMNLAGIYLSLAAVCVYRAGAGPGAAFDQLLFMIAIFICAVHPARRTLLGLAAVTGASLTPTWYEPVGALFAAHTLSQTLLTWSVGLIILGWMTRVRRRRAEAEEAVELARVDALTGLGNRRALEEALPVAVATARRTATALSVLVADLDDFKHVNDRHGHQAGDDLLRSAARGLTAALRLSDPGFRYGGDEFVAILPEAGMAEAAEVASRVQSTIALSCRTPDGRPLRASVGVAELAEGETGADAFARADAQLLAAKAQRRRRSAAAAG